MLDPISTVAQLTSAELAFVQAIADHTYTDGQLIIGNGSTGGVSVATLTAGSGVTITNGHGTISISASGGSATAITVGTTNVSTGTDKYVLYDNAGVLGAYNVSGSGSVAMTTSPSFTTPTLGVASATSINKMAITAPVTSSTLAVADGKIFTASNTLTLAGTDGKTLTVSNNLTLAGTDGTTMTFPGTSATIARTDAANTFTGTQTITTLAGIATITGTTGNMTITAGTGNSRTLILQTTTSGGTATTFLTGNADQSATFAAGVTVGGTLALSTNSITMSGSIGITGTRVTKGWFTDLEVTNTPTVNGTALSSIYSAIAGSSSIVTVGTVTSGTWNATTIAVNHGGTGVTSVTTAPGASAWAGWDASKNLSANNLIDGFTTTATAAGTTAMDITYTGIQVWTGSSTQTVKLPTTSVVAGGQYTIINNSSGAVTVQSSGANTITILAAGTSAVFTSVVATPTTAANWNSQYFGATAASGGSLTTSGAYPITLTATASTGVTLPTSGTLVNTGVATLSSLTSVGTITTGGLGTGATIGGVTMSLGSDAVGDIYAATASNVLSRIAAVAVGQVLISKGTTTLPAWSASATLSSLICSNNAVTASGNAATVPVTSRLTTVTNNSAATLTITITTTNAVDGQLVMVRVLDATAVAQTITWVNTENSTVTAPVLSNGSTTLFLTVGFIYNSATSKWRCIASA